MSESQRRVADRLAGRIIEIPDAGWVDPSRTNAQQFKPDREKLNDGAKARYDKLVEMGLENKLSMRTIPGVGSNLSMSIRIENSREDGSLKTQYATVEDRGNRNSVLAFAEKFAEPVSQDQKPLMYASGYIKPNDANARFQVHFAENEAEKQAFIASKKQEREAAGGNKGRGAASASNKPSPRDDDEIPF